MIKSMITCIGFSRSCQIQISHLVYKQIDSLLLLLGTANCQIDDNVSHNTCSNSSNTGMNVLATAYFCSWYSFPLLRLSLPPLSLPPAMFLLDAYRTVYVWLGWWPQERRDWSIMRETNITTGSAHARWLRDKKLALQTAQLYAKGYKIILMDTSL